MPSIYVLVESYSYTIANAAIWLATLLDIYSSIDIRPHQLSPHRNLELVI